MAKVIDQLQWTEESGSITYNGVRYLLIRPETLTVWQEQMEANCSNSGELIFKGGLAGGRLSGRQFAAKMGFNTRQMVDFMLEMGSQIGWGHFVLEELGDESLKFSVQHSPFAAGHKASEDGVCHLIRGVFAGVAGAVFDSEVHAVEDKCLAKGDDHCHFIFQKVSNIDS